MVDGAEDNTDDSNLATLANKLGDLFVADAEARTRATRYTRGGLVIIGGLAAGIAQFLDTPEHGVAWNIVIGFIGATFASVGGLWALMAEQTAPQALEAARRALDEAKRRELSQIAHAYELESLTDDWRWLSELYSAAGVLREAVENLISSDELSDADLQRLLDGIGRQLHGLLGYGGGEYWTIAIFRYSAEGTSSGELRCVAHQRSDRSDESRERRSWLPGEGIAGHSYQANREIVVHDVRDAQNGGWVHVPPHKRKPEDSERYRSMAAVPVRVSGMERLWGVVVATSDQPGRFTIDSEGSVSRSVEPLRLFAGMVALAIAPHYIRNVHAEGRSK